MQNSKINIALLCGGRSSEREVSLSGAEQVESAFDSTKYSVKKYDALTDIARLVQDKDTIDAVFILLHGRYGEDGTVQGMLDLLDLPYQGADVTGSALAMNKHLSKLLYRDGDVPTPDWLIFDAHSRRAVFDKLQKDFLPVMVKPCAQGSSVGMRVVKRLEEIEPSLEDAFKWDDQVMLESYVSGREITVGVLEDIDSGRPFALPPVEIIPDAKHTFFDYEAKYIKGEATEICPAPIPGEVAEKAEMYALKAHKILGLRDYSRTDMMLSDDGSIYVIETNTIPGMTRTSLLPLAAAEAGISFDALLDMLVSLALRRRTA